MTKKNILAEIEKQFDELFVKYGYPEIRKLDTNIDIIKNDMETYGLCILEQPFDGDNDCLTNVLRNYIKELSLHLFGIANPMDNQKFCEIYDICKNKYNNFSQEEQILASLSYWFNSSNGFGNCSFKFMFFQYTDNNISAKINKEKVFLDRNPFHRHNLEFLLHQPILWDILKKLHSNETEIKPMVSWDSGKIRFYDKKSKATKPVLTRRHRDVYRVNDISIDRIQAMLVMQHTGAVSLGWSMYSHNNVIQKLIYRYLKKEPNNFAIMTDEALAKILDKYWISFNKGFVIWKQETFHYEGMCSDIANNEFLYRLQSFTQPPTALDKFSFRFCLGSQIPINLNKKELKRLAIIVSHGYQPSIYGDKNKNNKYGYNTVDKKTTQYKIPRNQTDYELCELDKLKNVLKSSNSINEYISELDNTNPLLLEMFGI
jgi:hypothetical protein